MSSALSSANSASASILFLLHRGLLVLLSSSSEAVRRRLLRDFCVLRRLCRRRPLAGRLLRSCFSSDAMGRLKGTVTRIRLPPLSLVGRYGRLLRSLSIGCRGRKLCRSALGPVLTLTRRVSRTLSSDAKGPSSAGTCRSALLRR